MKAGQKLRSVEAVLVIQTHLFQNIQLDLYPQGVKQLLIISRKFLKDDSIGSSFLFSGNLNGWKGQKQQVQLMFFVGVHYNFADIDFPKKLQLTCQKTVLYTWNLLWQGKLIVQKCQKMQLVEIVFVSQKNFPAC